MQNRFIQVIIIWEYPVFIFIKYCDIWVFGMTNTQFSLLSYNAKKSRWSLSFDQLVTNQQPPFSISRFICHPIPSFLITYTFYRRFEIASWVTLVSIFSDRSQFSTRLIGLEALTHSLSRRFLHISYVTWIVFVDWYFHWGSFKNCEFILKNRRMVWRNFFLVFQNWNHLPKWKIFWYFKSNLIRTDK